MRAVMVVIQAPGRGGISPTVRRVALAGRCSSGKPGRPRREVRLCGRSGPQGPALAVVDEERQDVRVRTHGLTPLTVVPRPLGVDVIVDRPRGYAVDGRRAGQI